jgi:hypothetical protein
VGTHGAVGVDTWGQGMRRDQLLIGLLWISAGYLVLDALYHFSGVRLQDTAEWPAAAQSFALYMSWLWGSFALFMAGVLASMARSRAVRLKLAVPVAAWAVFHALLVVYLGSQNLPQLWQVPSLVFWTSYFGWILRAEAVSLLSFAGLLLWERQTSAASNLDAPVRGRPRTKSSN